MVFMMSTTKNNISQPPCRFVLLRPATQKCRGEKLKIKDPQQKTTIQTEIAATSEENYPVAEARNIIEVKKLLAKGYKYEMDFDGIKLFTKK